MVKKERYAWMEDVAVAYALLEEAMDPFWEDHAGRRVAYRRGAFLHSRGGHDVWH